MNRALHRGTWLVNDVVNFVVRRLKDWPFRQSLRRSFAAASNEDRICRAEAILCGSPESGRGLPHSKNWRQLAHASKFAKRLGVRQSSAAFARVSALCLWIALLVLPGDVHAHAGELHDQHWTQAWNWDPLIGFNLALLTGLYTAGLVKLWRKAGIGSSVSRSQAVAFFLGMLALFVALISPLDILSAELSSAHMVQHMTLMNVAAPLLVIGSPALVLLWALPLSARHSVGRWMHRVDVWQSPHYPLWQPLVLWLVYAFTLWIWHLPVFYEAALRNQWIHDFQHLSFVITACLFWRVLFDPVSRLRLSRGLAVIYLFTTSLHATVLGVFMALSPTVWYAEYEPLTPAWNLTPMEDQQLAGLIMWMPACLVYALAAAVLFGLWLRETPPAPDRQFQPSEGAQQP
jgi:putative membrane protein